MTTRLWRRTRPQQEEQDDEKVSASFKKTNNNSKNAAGASRSKSGGRGGGGGGRGGGGGVVGAIENVVHAAGYKDYQFGDLTKKTTEGVVRTVTGHKEYEFGDFTKGMLHDLEKEFATTAMVDVPHQLQQACARMTAEQRTTLTWQSLQCLGLGVLSLNFVLNACTALNMIACWTVRLLQTSGTASPLTSLHQWSLFCTLQKSERFLLGPICLPAQCAAAFFVLFKFYWKAVAWVERNIVLSGERSKRRQRKQQHGPAGDDEPSTDGGNKGVQSSASSNIATSRGRNRRIVHRIQSILVVFVAANILLWASVTVLGIGLAHWILGVPLKP